MDPPPGIYPGYSKGKLTDLASWIALFGRPEDGRLAPWGRSRCENGPCPGQLPAASCPVQPQERQSSSGTWHSG
eukprot:731753-Pyramimonas_sp.AAC.1